MIVPARILAAVAVVAVAPALAAQAAPQPPAPPTRPTTTSPSAPAAPAAPAAPSAPSAPVAPAAPAYLATHAEAMEIGRATARHAFSANVDSLMASADPATGGGDALRERLRDGLGQIAMQLGGERRMISERVVKIDGRIEYHRTAEYEMVPVPLVFRVILGAQNKWRGFTANTVENTPDGEEVKP